MAPILRLSALMVALAVLCLLPTGDTASCSSFPSTTAMNPDNGQFLLGCNTNGVYTGCA